MRGARHITEVVVRSAAATVLICVTMAVPAAPPGIIRVERPVGPGVTHVREKVSTGPLNYNVLQVDLLRRGIRLETEKGKDRLFSGEKVQATAKRDTRPGHTVIGAVNADFWASSPRLYMQIGLFVDENMIYNSSLMDARSVLAVTRDGKVHLGPVTLKTTLESGQQVVPIEGINDLRATNTISLFTPPYGSTVSIRKHTLYTVRLDKPEFVPNRPVTGTVTRIDTGTTVPLKKGHVVLSVPPDLRHKVRFLGQGRRVTLKAEVTEIDGVIEYCVGGGPRLVHNGEVHVDYESEKMGRSFSETLHPRTAVGISADGSTLYLVVVDGRQPRLSVGVGLEELARYMRDLGCAEAINFDGGGSSTMVVRGEVVNSPSDRLGPRTVANALLVISTKPAGPLSQIAIEPHGQPLAIPAGVQARFSASGFDADFNPVDIRSRKLTWTTTGDIGTLDASGTSATVTTAGTSRGTLSVTAGGNRQASVPIEVSPAADIGVDPEVFVLSSGEKSSLTITATSSGGVPLLLQPEMIRLKPSDDSVLASLQGVSGIRDGQGTLEIGIGASRKLVPYFVDRFRSVLLDGFDQLPTSTTLEGTNFVAKESRIALDSANRKQGMSSLVFTYSMSKGGTSQIILPVDIAITTQPEKIAVWIYGDGKEAWIRGDMEDTLHHHFMLDFTDGSKGCYWNKEWRQVMVPVRTLTPRPGNPAGRIVYPARIRQLYVAQDQEALKASGTIQLDGLEAIYAP
jgi:hypothetical protein